MRHVAWVISRFALAGWVGASTLFVLLVMDLRRSPLFDSETKFNHTKVLFPLFYRCEFILLGLAWICGCLALRHPGNPRWAHRVQWGLVTLALVMALADYFVVYRRLAEMMQQPALPMTFRGLHQWTIYLNALILVVCFVASLVSLWPANDPPAEIPSTSDASRPA